jgi:hypothetical protein
MIKRMIARIESGRKSQPVTASSLAGRMIRGVLLGLFGLLCLVGLGIGAVSIYWASGLGSQSISPDLAFRVVCADPNSTNIDEQAEVFLRQRGFAVINKIEAARKLGQPALLLRDILAVDAQSREVTLIQIPFGNRSISMGLRTLPPTRHDEELEAALLSFAESVAGCHAHQVTRNDNGPELRCFHDELIKMDARLLRKFGGQ